MQDEHVMPEDKRQYRVEVVLRNGKTLDLGLVAGFDPKAALNTAELLLKAHPEASEPEKLTVYDEDKVTRLIEEQGA